MVVIKISGKFVSPLDKPKVEDYSRVLNELIERGLVKGIVVGGGTVARKYISLVPNNKALRDFMGIEVSRLNATLLALNVKKSCIPVPKNIEQIISCISKGLIPVLGGLQPGQSTNAVALILAELTDSKLVVNATTVDAVYDKPPHEPGAKKLREVTVDQLREILSSEWHNEPGRYELMDDLALSIAKRSNIKIAIVDGEEPKNVLKAITEGIYGTLILP